MPLSDTTVRNAKPTDRQRKLSDEKGLYLLVHPNGSKYWRYKYRFHGKEKTLALGVYPAVTLSEAREKRDEARKLLAKDPPVDPSTFKQAQKTTRRVSAENSFEAVAREWIATHMANRSASHTDRVLRRFELYLFPWIGANPISDITPPELLEPIKRIQKLNKLETAHRVLQSAGQVFRYAVHSGKAQRDITADLKGALPPTTVKHMAALTKPEDVGELLRAIDGFTGTLTVQTALELAPLVFVRPNELRKAKWADIDLKAAEWSYNLSKAKPGQPPIKHLVPLARQAVQILEELYPYSGHGEFVFMGGHDPKKPMSEAAVNAALRRMGYDTQTQITGHGFRAIARTILHEKLNFDPNVIEHQLGHTVPDILGTAYNRTKFIDQRREMMQAWADYLDELKAGSVRK